MIEKVDYSENESININSKKGSLLTQVASLKSAFNFFSCGNFLTNPDPVLKKANKDISAYNEIRIDSHVKACIRSRKAGALSMLWDIDRGKAKSKHAKFIAHIFNKLPIYKIMADILEAPLFGYKPLEINWSIGTIAGRESIIPTSIKGKPVEWFVFNDENQLLFRSKNNYFGEALPDKKFLCPRQEETEDNPYGFPDLSLCFWSYIFKKGGIKFWLRFIEKYGMPFLVGKTPRGSDKAENAELLDKLDEMIQDACAVIPDDSSVEIMEGSKTSSSSIYKDFLFFMNSEISKAILGQTLTTEIQDKGTYGAAKVHLEVRDDIVMADTKLIEETFNQLIEYIIELNFGTIEETPKFIMYREQDVDLNLAQRDQIITNMGFSFNIDYMVRKYFFQEGDIVPSNGAQSVSNFAEKQNKIKETNIVDELNDILSDDDLQDYLEKILKPVIKKIKENADYTELQDTVAKVFPNMDTKDFQKVFEKILFISNIVGRIGGI